LYQGKFPLILFFGTFGPIGPAGTIGTIEEFDGSANGSANIVLSPTPILGRMIGG
jgi:hypothetical protein